MKGLRVIPLEGVPEVTPGADLAALLCDAAGDSFEDGDVLVVAHKVVSKAEARLAPVSERTDAALAEAARVVRRSGDLLITETRHGFVCANSGVDQSNAPDGLVVLLPLDPDSSARRLRSRIKAVTGRDVAVIVSDTFGRPWRLGQTNIAIGVAGMSPFIDYRGTRDMHGRDLYVTRICVADELAGAAEIVMGKASGVCAAVVRGAPIVRGRGAAKDIPRPSADDLFR